MFTHTNAKGTTYHLNTKEVNFGGKMRPIYYFSKDERPEACEKPEGYEVGENTHTGMVFLKKAK